jgi:hypothetical protein
VSGEHGRQVAFTDDEHPLVHSRRAVPTQRCAYEFARGACGKLSITSMPSAVTAASKTAVNVVSRSRSRNRSRAALVEAHQ